MSERDIENIAKLDRNFAWEIGKNVMMFGADMSLSVHIDDKSKEFLILGEGTTQGLDDTIWKGETKYEKSFEKKLCIKSSL